MKEQLEVLKSKSLSEHKKDPTQLISFFKELYGRVICPTCPGAVEAAYSEISNITHQKIEIMSNKILRVKSDTLIDTYMSPVPPQGHYTDKNITDEIGVQLIDNGLGGYFENPEDVEEARKAVAESSKEEGASNIFVPSEEKETSDEVTIETFSAKELTAKLTASGIEIPKQKNKTILFDLFQKEEARKADEAKQAEEDAAALSAKGTEE